MCLIFRKQIKFWAVCKDTFIPKSSGRWAGFKPNILSDASLYKTQTKRAALAEAKMLKNKVWLPGESRRAPIRKGEISREREAPC